MTPPLVTPRSTAPGLRADAPGSATPPFSDVGLVGVSHRTTDVKGLAAFARDAATKERATRELLALGLTEVMLLTTCNRSEVLYVHDGAAPARLLGQRILRAAMTAACEGPLPPHFGLDGADALTHLFEVSTSIDSLVVGERQILRQLRHAVADGERWRSVGPRLRGLTSEAFRVARQARKSTGLCRGASVVSLAADRLARAAASVDAPVAVVGAGDMSEHAAMALSKRRLGSFLFVNRTPERALRLAERFGGKALSLEEFLSSPPAVAAVVTATSASSSLFRECESAALLAARRAAGLRGRLLFVDFAVPFDVDESMRGNAELDIVRIDDLRVAAAAHAEAQHEGIAQTQSLLTTRVRRLMDREARRGEGVAFGHARAHGEAAARAEVDKLSSAYSATDVALRDRLERWAVAASHRFAHGAWRGGAAAVEELIPAEELRLDSLLARPIGIDSLYRSARAIAGAVLSAMEGTRAAHRA